MKNMKKFITLCGFLILGSIACGDVDIVKAEAINNQATDTSGYTITIPSDVDIDKESGKGSFAVTGNVKAQSTIDVSIQSKNGYKLKNKSKDLPYNIDKKSFSFDNSKSTSDLDINEVFNISSDTNTNFSGNYEDRLTFNIESHKFAYKVDLNAVLDGKTVYGPHSYGVFDIYVNGELVASDVSDWEEIYPYGTEYEIKNIKATDGHHYDGIDYGKLKGRFGENGKTRITAQLKFDTNKLTVNYHADGAQSFKYFDNTIQNVDGKDIAYTGVHLYGNHYDATSGLVDVSRLSKKGYTAKSRIWSVGKNGNKEIRDDKGLSKVEDIANYCGVLDEFKKNDVTIDLFPIWSADEHSFTIAHWLRLNKAGNGNNDEWKDCYNLGYSSHMIKSDATFIFDSSLAKKIPNGCYLDGDMIIFRDNTSGDYITKSLPYEFTQPAETNSGGQYYYIPYKYKITYDLNGGMENSNKNPSTYTVLDGISLAKPKRIGYTFDGWYDENGNKLTGINEGCTDKFKSIDDVYTQLAKRKTGDIKLTAHWKKYANQYVARFHSNGGQLNIIDDSITDFGNDSNNGFVDVIYTLNASWYWQLGVQANKTGYTCTGYYDAPEGGTKVFDYVYLDNIKQCAGVAVPNTKYFNSDHRWIYENDLELYPHWEATVPDYDLGTILNIDGSDYIVMSQTDNGKYLVMRKDSIGNKQFHVNADPDTWLRPDGLLGNTYEGSEIDNNLENEWYNSLSSTMKAAIQTTSIKQASYSNDSPDAKQETGYNGQVYNTISRHAFLPSVDEIGKVVDLKNPDKVKAFLNGTTIWTRDSRQLDGYSVMDISADNNKLDSWYTDDGYEGKGVCPAFVIDLSLVNYSVVK